MALSKPIWSPHFLRFLPRPTSHFLPLRLLSSATPQQSPPAARRTLRPPTTTNTVISPKTPTLPEPISALSGNRLVLHNRILKLIRDDDLDEAALLTRHSIYSNCRPTIYTCNSVMAALLRRRRHSDLLALHRFVSQAGVAPNIFTFNLLLSSYMDCRRTDTAVEHYNQLVNDAPFNPSPTTYRILIKGLVDNDRIEKGIQLKDDMLSKGLDPDPIVYSYLMSGQVKKSNPDGIFELYEELKEKLGGFMSDGVVYGNLMKGYFLKGMEREAMECYEEAVGENSRVRMSEMAFNYILDALSKNGKFDEALKLFDRMKREHNPPRRLTVNLDGYNVMVDGYCAHGRFDDAIEVFNNMEEMRCRTDTFSYNNLMKHLCENSLLGKAEELFKDMGERGVSPDESTYDVLIDTCFKENRPDDAAGYYRTMTESKLRPNLMIYNKLVEGLVKFGKVDEAKSFFDETMEKVRMSEDSYKFMMNALCEIGKLDEVLDIVSRLYRKDPLDFTSELQELVKEALRKAGREEEELTKKVMEDIDREKAEARAREAEAAERAKASARAAVAQLISSKFFRNSGNEDGTTVANDNPSEAAMAASPRVEEEDSRGGAIEQVAA